MPPNPFGIITGSPDNHKEQKKNNNKYIKGGGVKKSETQMRRSARGWPSHKMSHFNLHYWRLVGKWRRPLSLRRAQRHGENMKNMRE